MKRNRFFALVLAVLMTLVTLSSCLFIALEINHECMGEECLICQQMSFCVKIVIGYFCCILAAALGSQLFALRLKRFDARQKGTLGTLVSLKVKLSN